MIKEINIGLVGIGTIGSGVVEILDKNASLIEKRTGVKINLVKVCDLNETLAKKIGVDGVFTKDYKEILNDSGIDVVVELIGGYEPAHSIIIEAINAGKHVVTANKAVLAKFGYEIFEVAQKNNVNVLFEAAVGGCIPIIRTIEETYPSDKIENIYGILNGTTNYILTKMTEGMSYVEALKKAQELGFAEADPTFDVEGMDASQKMTILSSLVFDAKIMETPFTDGITRITKQDMEYAKELGYVIKLIAMGIKRENGIEIRTHPTMIPSDHVLAGVNNEYNAVLFSGENVKEVMLSGKGAGKLPTASVVVTDIIELGSRMRVAQRHFEDTKLVPMKDIKSKYYLRFSLVDEPGIFANIAKILGDNNVSIAAVSQKESDTKKVPVVIITHEALEEDLMNSIKEYNALDDVSDEAVVIRIDDLI
jgi:homoserine dehydrogenase